MLLFQLPFWRGTLWLHFAVRFAPSRGLVLSREVVSTKEYPVVYEHQLVLLVAVLILFSAMVAAQTTDFLTYKATRNVKVVFDFLLVASGMAAVGLLLQITTR